MCVRGREPRTWAEPWGGFASFCLQVFLMECSWNRDFYVIVTQTLNISEKLELAADDRRSVQSADPAVLATAPVTWPSASKTIALVSKVTLILQVAQNRRVKGSVVALAQSNHNNAFVTTHTEPAHRFSPLVMAGPFGLGEASVRLAARPHAWPTPEIIAAYLFAWSHRRGRACAWTLALTPELFPMLLSLVSAT